MRRRPARASSSNRRSDWVARSRAETLGLIPPRPSARLLAWPGSFRSATAAPPSPKRRSRCSRSALLHRPLRRGPAAAVVQGCASPWSSSPWSSPPPGPPMSEACAKRGEPCSPPSPPFWSSPPPWSSPGGVEPGVGGVLAAAHSSSDCSVTLPLTVEPSLSLITSTPEVNEVTVPAGSPAGAGVLGVVGAVDGAEGLPNVNTRARRPWRRWAW